MKIDATAALSNEAVPDFTLDEEDVAQGHPALRFASLLFSAHKDARKVAADKAAEEAAAAEAAAAAAAAAEGRRGGGAQLRSQTKNKIHIR